MAVDNTGCVVKYHEFCGWTNENENEKENENAMYGMLGSGYLCGVE